MFKIFSALSGISGLVGGVFAYHKTNHKTDQTTVFKFDPNASLNADQSDSPFKEKIDIEFLDDGKMITTINIFAEYSAAIIKKYELDNPYSQKRNEFYEKYDQWAYFDDETKEKQRIIEEKKQAAKSDWLIRHNKQEKLKNNNNNSKEIKV